jgi:hypothetical protein
MWQYRSSSVIISIFRVRWINQWIDDYGRTRIGKTLKLQKKYKMCKGHLLLRSCVIDPDDVLQWDTIALRQVNEYLKDPSVDRFHDLWCSNVNDEWNNQN